MGQHRDPPSRTGLSARVVVLLMMLVYGLMAGGIAGYASWSDYRQTVVDVERSTADLARLLEDHFLHALQSTDLLLLHVAEGVRTEGLAGLDEGGDHWTLLKAAVATAPHLDSLFVVDAADRLVASTRGRPPRPLKVAGKDFAAAIADGAERFIGQVARDPWTDVYTFPVARRLTGRDGGFAGIAVAQVRVSFFKSLYHGLNLGADPGLGVYRLDGAILVREPLPEADVGRNMSKNPVYTTHLPRAPIGDYHGKSAYDGVVRIVSYRKVEGPQLLVWVAMSLDDALLPWQERLVRNVGLALFGLAMAIGLAVLAMRSINRERQAKLELERSNLSLQRANTELERFAEVAAHHLQEPLRVIASYAQLIEKRLKDEVKGEVAEFLGYLVTGSNDMKRLMHDLQRYTALEQKEPVEVRLDEVAAKAVADLRDLAASTGADITIGELPVVRGDARQLHMLLRQLVENALTYRAPDRAPRIEVSARRAGAEWEISVADNGIGIEPRFQERIFRIFERLHPRHLFPGTGIGLAMCRKIVECHGGRIWCGGDQPQGVTFTFTLAA